MHTYLSQFDAIVLDMNGTFMFGGDRFALGEDYFQTYTQLGGGTLTPFPLKRAINGLFTTMEEVYLDPARHDDFPSVEEAMRRWGELPDLPGHEQTRLADLIAIHELGQIPSEYVQAIRTLAATSKLHLVSNVWGPKRHAMEVLNDNQIANCFETITFSSDSRSVKPSVRLFDAVLKHVSADRAVMIGDCLRCDIGAANKIGMHSVWLSHGRTRPEGSPSPKLVVRDLLSLIDFKSESAGLMVRRDVAECARRSLESDSLQNEFVRFRPTGKEDVAAILAAENEADNASYIVNWSEERHLSSLTDDDVLSLIVERVDTKEAVGYLIFRGLREKDGPIELKRIVITKKRYGFGYQALELAKRLVFKRLQRRRLWLNVLPDNDRARSLYRKAGFRYEGTWRDSFLTDSGFADLELMTALSTDRKYEPVVTSRGGRFHVVRSFSSKQQRQFCELYDREWPDGARTNGDLEKAVLGSEFVVGVIESASDDLVGFCRVVTDRGFRAWIHGLIVREELRGLGLGRLIMREVLASDELQGIHSVSLTCAPRMQAFYRKWGFEVKEMETVMNLSLRQPRS
jgi:FMN phosphatase YigB (HAD superfamily)/RimJ/RimL family protein N-acetyltransferase